MITIHQLKERISKIEDCSASELPNGQIIITPLVAPDGEEQPVHFCLTIQNQKYILSDNGSWCSTIYLDQLGKPYSTISYVSKSQEIIDIIGKYECVCIKDMHDDKTFTIATIPFNVNQIEYVCHQIIAVSKELYDILHNIQSYSERQFKHNHPSLSF